VSIVAAAAMLFVLLFLKAPLMPTAALAAIVFVSAISLFDVTALRDVARMSLRDDLALRLPAAAA
jgi:MFS superfamily sulfate permease-like transporter